VECSDNCGVKTEHSGNELMAMVSWNQDRRIVLDSGKPYPIQVVERY